MVLAACGPSGASTAFVSDKPTPSSTSVATVSREVTKPPVSQAPLPAPTRLTWAIDHADQPGRHLFEIHFDGSAVGFRVVDASGRQVLVVPIAGSGIFGPETRAATWVAVDEPTYQDLLANAATYRIEVETIGHGTITLPLVDSGCRRS